VILREKEKEEDGQPTPLVLVEKWLEIEI